MTEPAVADIRAATWCEQYIDEPDDSKLLASFHKIRSYFLGAIDRYSASPFGDAARPGKAGPCDRHSASPFGDAARPGKAGPCDRSRAGLFAGISRCWVVDVIRKWMEMYRCCVADVRARFPRTDDSADLVMLGRNWSRLLGISYEGLERLDLASRYAQLWAERSMAWATTQERGDGMFETFVARMSFIGSPQYRLYDTLVRDERLMIRDPAWNGIPSFDVIEALAGIAEPHGIEAECARRDWLVEHLHTDARAALWHAAHA